MRVIFDPRKGWQRPLSSVKSTRAGGPSSGSGRCRCGGYRTTVCPKLPFLFRCYLCRVRHNATRTPTRLLTGQGRYENADMTRVLNQLNRTFNLKQRFQSRF